MSRRLLPLLCLAALALTGCRDDPAVVLNAARDALTSKSPDEFLALVDPQSRAFLTRSQHVVKVSAQTFEVLGARGFAPDLLPSGDIVEDPEDGDHCMVLNHHLCLVEVRKGTRVARVPMRLVRGQWRVALLEMDGFLDHVLPR